MYWKISEKNRTLVSLARIYSRSLCIAMSVMLFVSGELHAQVGSGGTPKSFSVTLPITIDTKTTPSVNIDSLLAADALEKGKNIPERFGFAFDVDLGLNNSGTWHTLPDSGKVWRLRIDAPGAFSINLIYDAFRLPSGAELFIYNQDTSMVIGAFTEQNNKPHGKFSTAPVKGSASILEYYEPAGVEKPGAIHISKLIYGYKSLFSSQIKLRKTGAVPDPDAGAKIDVFGDAGSCNINIACSQGMPWWAEGRSVAMVMLSDNTRICSGSLLNNVRENFTPYFLSAFHCADDNDNEVLSSAEKSAAETWIFMFKYESATCSNPSTEPLTGYTISGATFRAAQFDSDFLLLELSRKPPMSYNVYFNGWSNIDTAPTSSVGIHHPSGDIKKISFENDQAVSTGITLQGPNQPHTYPANSQWQVTWDSGITEGGSSGSPLYDQNRRVVGKLTGGSSSCSNQNNPDWYGKISLAWTGDGTSSTRLKDWLDPDNTGVTTLDGTELLVTISGPGELQENESATYTATVTGGSGSITYAWDKQEDGSSHWVPLGNGSTQLVTAGSIPFTLRVTVSRSGMFAEDTYYVWITGYGGQFKITDPRIPQEYNLYANYPNPFNPSTTIRYALPEKSSITLLIYNRLGHKIMEWHLEERAGEKHMIWDGRDKNGLQVASGVYFYKLIAISRETGKMFVQSRKMLLLK